MDRIEVIRQATKQVAQILSGRDIEVTQRGMNAYVRYNDEGEPQQVNIPFIPDNASDALIDAIQGFLDHEVGHLLFTNFKLMKRSISDGFGSTMNIVEDPFVERKIGQRFFGSTHNIDRLHHFFIEKFVKPEVEKAQAAGDKNALVSILMVPLIRAWSGQDVFKRYMQTVQHEIADFVEKLGDDIEPMLLKIESTEDSYKVAEEIHHRMKSMKQQPPPQQPQQSDDGDDEDEKQSGNYDDGEDGQEGDDPQDGESNADEGDSEGEGLESSDSEGDESEGDESEGDESEGDESEGDSDESDSDESDSDESDEDGDSDDEGEDGEGEGSTSEEDDGQESDDEGAASNVGDMEGESSEGDEGDDEGQQNNGSESEHEVGGDDLATDFDIDQIMNGIEENDFDKMAATAISDEAQQMMQGAQYRVFTTDFDKHEPYETRNIAEVKGMEDRVDHMMNVVQKAMERFIVARSRSQWIPGQRRGKLNTRSLAGLAVAKNHPEIANERVFKRLEEHTSKDIACAIAVDCSGSMAGRKITTAMDTAYAFSTVLDRLKIKHAVYGFTTQVIRHDLQEAIQIEFEKNGNYLPTYSRTEPLYLPIFKSFGERMGTKVKERLSAFPQDWNKMRYNIDGESLRVFARELAQRPESAKLLMVLSDGAPNPDQGVYYECNTDTKRAVEEIEKSGMTVIGIGIKDSAVKQFYTNHIILESVDDLPTTVMGELKRVISANIH